MATIFCPNCGGISLGYEGTDWCESCVIGTLDEQKKQDNRRQDKVVIDTLKRSQHVMR